MLLVWQHCPVRAVLQLPSASLHHWSQCCCDGRKLHILALMFSGSLEMWSLLDPAPREVWCPGMMGRIFGPDLQIVPANLLFSLSTVFSVQAVLWFKSYSFFVSCFGFFFPSQHICTLFISSVCNASSMTHAGIYPSCFCLTWPGAVLGSELVVTCSVVSICSPVCR